MIRAHLGSEFQRHTMRAKKIKLSRARILGVLAVVVTLMAAWSRSAQAEEGGWTSLGQGLSLVAAAQIGERGVLHRWAVVTRADRLGIAEPTAAENHLTQWRPMPSLSADGRSPLVTASTSTGRSQGLDLAHPMLAGLGLGLLILLIGWGLTRPADCGNRTSA